MTMPGLPLPFNVPGAAPSIPITPVSNSTVPVNQRTCSSCPSRIEQPTQNVYMDNSIGGAMCASKMLPLIAPNQPQNVQARVLKSTARSCHLFGDDMRMNRLPLSSAPDMPVGADADVYDPDFDQSNARCGSCANYVEPDEVLAKAGWTAPICRAEGNLQLPGYERQQTYAAKCGKFTQFNPAVHRRNLDTFIFFPNFQMEAGALSAAFQFRNSLKSVTDPRTVATDVPLTGDDIARNIRAFQRVTDPEGYGPDIMMPIFNKWPEFQELVPQIEDEQEPHKYADYGGFTYTLLAAWLHLHQTPALWGAGGVGKTDMGRFMAWKMQLPFFDISITAESSVDEIIGKYTFENGETKFNYGRLPTAWGRAAIILLDEPNTGPNEVWQQIRPLADNRKRLVVGSNKSEYIDKHRDAYLQMAMNPNWDVLNVGTNVIGDADLSRLFHIYVAYPPEDLEKEIIRARSVVDGVPGVTDKQLNLMMKATKDLRRIAHDGQLDSSWGIRHNIKVGKALTYFPPQKAYRLALSDSLPPDQIEIVSGIVNSHFKGSAS